MEIKSLEEKVKEFLALKTHAEKWDYFHANPELGRIFGAHHYSKPKPAPAPETVTNHK
jgi:hypothetical protein